MESTATANSTQPLVWSLPFEGPWLVLRYCPTGLWSLKSSQATSSGGKSLLIPTPYSIKLGLIDAAIQTGNVGEGERLFHLFSGRPLRICPPAVAVTSATFVKLCKVDVCPDKRAKETEAEYEQKIRQTFLDYYPRADANEVSKAPLERLRRFLHETFSPTVGFREYVLFSGDGDQALLQVALAGKGIGTKERALLARAALACSYSGKRGSFLRFVPADTEDGLVDIPEISPESPYSLPSSAWRSSGVAIPLGTIQPLDELSIGAKWDNVNSYSVGKIYAAQEGTWAFAGKKQIEPDRVFVQTFIPYSLTASSRGYSYYRRTDVV